MSRGTNPLVQQTPRRNGQHVESPARPEAAMEGYYTPPILPPWGEGPRLCVCPTPDQFEMFNRPWQYCLGRNEQHLGTPVRSMIGVWGAAPDPCPCVKGPDCGRFQPWRNLRRATNRPPLGLRFRCGASQSRAVSPYALSVPRAAPPPPRTPATVLPFTPLKCAFSRACRLSEAPTPASGIGPQSRS